LLIIVYIKYSKIVKYINWIVNYEDGRILTCFEF